MFYPNHLLSTLLAILRVLASVVTEDLVVKTFRRFSFQSKEDRRLEVDPDAEFNVSHLYIYVVPYYNKIIIIRIPVY